MLGIPLAVILLALGGAIGFALASGVTSSECEDSCARARGVYGCMHVRGYMGVLCLVFIVPLGVLALAAGITELGQRRVCFHDST